MASNSEGTIVVETPRTQLFVNLARQAGYVVRTSEQLRANRWLLTLRDANRARIALLVQARRLIHAADVQDLAEIVQLRRCERGWLWAYGGEFSPQASRTLAEIGAGRIQFCTDLPPVASICEEVAGELHLIRVHETR